MNFLLPIKSIVTTILSNVAGMFFTKTVFLWFLKQLTKLSTNDLDDNFVLAGEAAYEGDAEKFMEYSEKVMEGLKKEFDNSGD